LLLILIQFFHQAALQIGADIASILPDIQLLSSIAVILGAIFVIFQLRQNNRLISASAEQARAAVAQAKVSNDQLKQENELANMDMIMRLYEFANGAEFQTSWVTVLTTKIDSFQEFLKLPRNDQIAFYQVAALFESLGVLVERGLVDLEIVEDMFAAQLAYDATKTFLDGMKEKYGKTDTYSFFEKLYQDLNEREGEIPDRKTTETATQRES
jgi:hypothetical protein